MKSLTIIGGGATGTLLAVNLINQATSQRIIVNLVEKQLRIGRGVAYSTNTDIHRLNVPADKMGAFPNDIEHFYRWLQDQSYDFSPDDFVPRRIYGEYLQSLFDDAVRNKGENVSINLIQDEAVDLSITDNKAEVFLKSGESIISDKVVLAFGNFLPPHLRTIHRDYISAPKYFQNPWGEETISKIATSDNVLLIGTGLTAVDSILSLNENNHTGKVYAVSTHGWFPSVHSLDFVYPDFNDELAGKTSLYELLKIVRKHVAKAEKEGSNWRAVIDSMRSVTQGIWLNLPPREKRRFLNRLRRAWDISRHRIPKECAAVLEQMQVKGQLNKIKGRVVDITQNQDGEFCVKYRLDDKESVLIVDVIINCTGSESNFSRLDFPFVKNLIEKGFIKPDLLALGLDAHPDGRVSEILYTIGTSLKGILWESVAMPELRTQADQLAKDLLAEI